MTLPFNHLARGPFGIIRRTNLVFRQFSSGKTGGMPKNIATEAVIEKTKPSVRQLPKNINKFVGYAKPAKKPLLLGILCLPGALISMMAVPLVVGKVIDLVSANLDSSGNFSAKMLNDGKKLGFSLVCLSLVGSVATFGRSYFINLSSEIIVKNLRATIFSKLLRNKTTAFYDTAKTGDLISRITSDTTIIANFVSESVSMGLRGVGTFTFGFGFLIYTSPVLAGISICSLLPLVGFSRIFGRKMKKQTNEQLTAFGASTAVAEEALAYVKTIQMFNRQSYQVDKYDAQLDEVLVLGKKLCLTRAQFFGVMQLILDTTMISLIASGSYLVFAKVLTPGELTSFLMYALYVAGANFQLTSVYSAAMKALGATQRIDEVTEENLAAEDKGLTKLFDGKTKFGIRFNDIKFSYPSRSEETVLKGLNLEIPAGKSVAVVGHSGCGKSTLYSLLTKLYQPNSGMISFVDSNKNEINLADIDTEHLREHLGVVTQEPIIFMSSIADNIRFGKLDATHEDIVKAAKLANIHDFIETLPEKYDSIVGQRGAQLSGGQKQRICIARAIVKDPEVLLLDEATSSLDIQSEALVQSALESLMPGRTTIVIAHRLSTIKSADYIALLEKGVVTQFGKLDEVVNSKGPFQDFLDTKKKE